MDWVGAAGGPARHFPSGHTTAATLFACLMRLGPRSPGPRWWPRRAVWAGVAV